MSMISGPTTPFTMSNISEDFRDTALTPGPTTPYYLPFLDQGKRRLAEILLDYVIVFSLAILGVATNILVIAVYAKQGFKESVSISMTTIAVWDLIKCLAGVMERFSGILSVWDPVAALSWANIGTVVFKYLICFSSYVTSVMAAYVAVERCLCVSIPLKVKWLLTPKVTLIACLVMSVVVFGAFAAMFGIYDIVWVWDGSLNATIAVYQRNDFYLQHQDPLFKYYNLSGILWPVAAFVVIVIATIIITYKLRQGSKFRLRQGGAPVTDSTSKHERSSSQSQNPSQRKQQNLTNRDRQVIKMLLVIIVIYIVSLSPRISHYLAKYFVYDFYFLRRYHHLFRFADHWLFVADFANGAVNFFVFYAMSTSFRSTFRAMVCRRSQTESLNQK